MTLVSSLCAWFATHQRDLPWRHTADPYAIWISEAMLQQTRVETVRAYYARFLAQLPTVTALAQASEDDVVALWSGLGYYRRARALRTAAQQIVREHGGVMPRDREAWLALPGVGPYTAGAVLSIAFDRSEALVDGNVARVFSRLFEFDDEPGGALQRKLWKRARELMPAAADRAVRAEVSPGNWNQALMELGALVCTAKAPDCAACPVAPCCGARRSGRVGELPRRVRRRPSIDVTLEVLVAQRAQQVLIVRRPSGGRMSRMWELPTRELADTTGDTHLWPSQHGLALSACERAIHRLSHSITHHRIRALVYGSLAPQDPTPNAENPNATAIDWRWTHVDDLANLALTGLSRKVLNAVL